MENEEIIIEESATGKAAGKIEKIKETFKKAANSKVAYLAEGVVIGIVGKFALAKAYSWAKEEFALSDDPAEELAAVEGEASLPTPF